MALHTQNLGYHIPLMPAIVGVNARGTAVDRAIRIARPPCVEEGVGAGPPLPADPAAQPRRFDARPEPPADR
jgi:hypothetical protein